MPHARIRLFWIALLLAAGTSTLVLTVGAALGPALKDWLPAAAWGAGLVAALFALLLAACLIRTSARPALAIAGLVPVTLVFSQVVVRYATMLEEMRAVRAMTRDRVAGS